ncbi:MAG: enoyl-CoA hydratase-related protein [Burkholderiaceae bacterium]
MTDPVLYTQSGGVATITLNRPEVLNALNPALNEQLLAAVTRAGADDEVRAVVMTGAGRAFCAGADLAGSANRAGTKLGDSLREHYHPIITGIRELPKPVIAAVNGPAAGAGMSIALSADVVLAGESASFLQAFAKIGLIPDAGSTWLLDRYAGAMRGRALAMLAEQISAADAKDYGLVWRVFSDDTLLGEASALAARMAQMPTRAFALIKQAMDAASSNDLAAQLEVEADLQTEAGMTEDFREGVTAFLEKRAPKFKGR